MQRFSKQRRSRQEKRKQDSSNRERILNPFTPKSDQFWISPADSSEILHHTVWRTWFFIAYSDGGWSILPILTTSLIYFSLRGWENILLSLGVKGSSNYKGKRHGGSQTWPDCSLSRANSSSSGTTCGHTCLEEKPFSPSDSSARSSDSCIDFSDCWANASKLQMSRIYSEEKADLARKISTL